MKYLIGIGIGVGVIYTGYKYYESKIMTKQEKFIKNIIYDIINYKK
jgi:hypothetical protein